MLEKINPFSKKDKSNEFHQINQPVEEQKQEKKDRLEDLKAFFVESFGEEGIPRELAEEVVKARRKIKDKIERNEFVDNLDEFEEEIKRTAFKIIHWRELQAAVDIARSENPEYSYDNHLDTAIKEINQAEDGTIEFTMKDGRSLQVESTGAEMITDYFDSYRLIQNSLQLKKNITQEKEQLVSDHADRKATFFRESEKTGKLKDRLKKRYKNTELEENISDEEWGELIQIADISDLEALSVEDIKLFAKVKEVSRRYFSGDKTKYVGLAAAMAVPAFMNAYLGGKFLAETFDATTDIDKISHVALYVGTIVSSGFLRVGAQKFYSKVMKDNYEKDGGMIDDMASNYMNFPPNEAQKFGGETIKRRTSDGVAGIERIIDSTVYDSIPAISAFLGAELMLLMRDPKLAAVSTIAYAVMYKFNSIIREKTGFWEKIGKSKDRIEDVKNETDQILSAHMEVALAGKKDEFEKRLRDTTLDKKIAEMDQKFWRVFQNELSTMLNSLSLVMATITWIVTHGDSGDFVAALRSSGDLQNAFNNFFRINRDALESVRDISEMERMFNGFADEEKEAELDRKGVSEVNGSDIKFENVGVSIGQKEILSELSFEIPAGSMVHLAGASGSGKTTLMKVMSGYFKPTSGNVSYGDTDMTDIKKMGDDSVFSQVAYQSQFPFVMEGTLADNLQFGSNSQVDKREMREALKMVGLESRFTNLNEKIHGGLGDSGSLSGGEASRLGLVRTLLRIRKMKSKIAFFDEPTASVDKKAKFKIAEIINEEKRNNPETTFLIISHDEEFIRTLEADQKIELHDGKLVN